MGRKGEGGVARAISRARALRTREGVAFPSFRLRKVRLRGMVIVVTCFSSGLSGVT